MNEQDLLALNNALSKLVSTNPENVARKRRNRMLLLMVMRLIARHPSFSKHPHALPPVTVITLSVILTTTTGLRPRLNVRQRKDTGYLPHSSPSLQFRPAILYSDGYLPLVPEDKNETDKIHTPRIVPQNWSARHLTPVALAVATVFYAGWL